MASKEKESHGTMPHLALLYILPDYVYYVLYVYYFILVYIDYNISIHSIPNRFRISLSIKGTVPS